MAYVYAHDLIIMCEPVKILARATLLFVSGEWYEIEKRVTRLFSGDSPV